eukprot:gene5345-12940_t
MPSAQPTASYPPHLIICYHLFAHSLPPLTTGRRTPNSAQAAQKHWLGFLIFGISITVCCFCSPCSVGYKFPLPAAIDKAVESVASVVRREKSFLPFRTSSAEAFARILIIVCVCCYCSPSSAAQQPSATKPLRSPHTPRAPRARMMDVYPCLPLAPYGGATMDEPLPPPHHLELLAAVTAPPASNTSDGRVNMDISHVNYSKAISEELNTSCGYDSNFPDPSGNPPHFQNQPKPQHQLLQQRQQQQQQQGPEAPPAYNPLYLHRGNGGSGPGGAGGRGAGGGSRMIPTQNGNGNGAPYHQGGRGREARLEGGHPGWSRPGCQPGSPSTPPPTTPGPYSLVNPGLASEDRHSDDSVHLRLDDDAINRILRSEDRHDAHIVKLGLDDDAINRILAEFSTKQQFDDGPADAVCWASAVLPPHRIFMPVHKTADFAAFGAAPPAATSLST